MRLIQTLSRFMIGVVLLLSTSLSIAHGNHEKVSAEEAMLIAQKAVSNMVKKDAGLAFGKLPESWLTTKNADMKVVSEGKGFYIVSVLNTSKNETLFFLIAKSGEVYDANFTGTFDGVNK